MKYTLRMAAAFCTLGLFAAALIGAPPKEVATSKEPTCAFCNEKECQKECQKECKHCLETRLEISAAAADADPEINASSAVRPGSRFGGPGARMRHGHGGDSQHQIDHEDFFFLIDHKETIRRTIKNLPDGIETVTESDDEAVAARIQKHVASMYDRVENVNPIRMRDPLFRELFANAKKIEMEFEKTKNGVRVKETSDDPYVAKLLQEHAKVVSKFIKNGYSELPKNHAPPKR